MVTLAPDNDTNLQPSVGTFAGGQRQARLRTFILLRWIAVLGQTVTVLAVKFIFGFDLPLAPALAVIAASAWLNLYLTASQPTLRFMRDNEVALNLGFDIVQLAVLISITGGMDNPFVVLMGAPVAIAFTALRARYALAIAGIALVATVAVWAFSAPLPWKNNSTFDPPYLYEWGLATSLITCTGFICVFTWRLANDARRMSEALAATQTVLAREQRLSALGSLAAAAAHELGTPLATIQVTAKEMARSLRSDGDLREDAELLVSQAERCRDILRQLSKRGDEEDLMHAQLDLAQLIDEVIEPFVGLGPEIDVELKAEAGAPSRGPKLRRMPELIHALTNYVENAVDFANTSVTVSATWSAHDVWIEVRDDGPGFSPEIIADLGQPFISQRPAGADRGGLGLGMFIAQTFVERTGGAVTLANTKPPGSGAVVRARWPLAAIAAREA